MNKISVIVSIAYSVLCTCCLILLLKKYWDQIPKEVDCPSDRSRKILFALLGSSLLGIAIIHSLYYRSDLLKTLRLVSLGSLVWGAGVIDRNEKRIPNKIILIGIVLAAVFAFAELIFDFEFGMGSVLNRLISAAVVFVAFLLFSLISRGGLGMGDIKLYFVIALLSDISGLFSIIFGSLLIAFIEALYLLAFRKKKKTDSIAFGPCILIGTIAAMLITTC